tara:strand:+ start:1012 stop:2298 length:1287 start_codon:yes stop_codon:yes gene_type:complete
MKIINLLTTLLLFMATCYAQEEISITTFDEINGNSNIKLINTFSNGDLVLVGENISKNSEKKNIFVLRTNSSGDIIWNKEFSSDKPLAVNSFLINDLDDIIIAAEQYEDGNRESLFLFGLKPNGTIIFSQHFNEAGGEVEAYDITSDKDGGFLITGFCKLPTIVSNVFFQMVKEDQFLYILKVNSLGEKLWSKYIEEDYFVSTGKKIILDKKSILNIFSNNHKDNKENVIKLITSKNNDTFQEYIFLSDNNAILSDVAYDGNSFYLTGLVTNDKNTDYYDIFLVKLNERYEIEYNKIISTNYNDWPAGISIKENKILLFGHINKKTKKEIFLIEFEKEKGNLNSIKIYEPPYQSISLMDGKNSERGLLLVGSCWDKKKVGILINTSNLKSAENEFIIINSDFVLQKSQKEKFINLNKVETISPVNLKN